MVNAKIVIRRGPEDEGFTVENDAIISAHANLPQDPSLAELAIGTLEAVLHISGFAENFCPSDYPDGMRSADWQTVYCRDSDNSTLDLMKYGYDVIAYANDNLVGTFYVKEVTQTGPSEYTLTAQNWTGVLDDFVTIGRYTAFTDGNSGQIKSFFTDMLTQSTMPAFLRDKIKDRLSEDALLSNLSLAAFDVFKGTIKEQVQQTLFCIGAYIHESTDGKLNISSFSSAERGTIPDDNLYLAGDITRTGSPGSIVVTEYELRDNSLSAIENMELLLDNTESGTDTDVNDVSWDGVPMSFLQIDSNRLITGGHIYHYTITGRHTIHGARMLVSRTERKSTSPDNSSGPEVVVDVQSVSPLLSYGVMQRLKAFYFSGRAEVDQDYVWTGEAPGSAYRFTDPFGEPSKGIIGDTTLDLSAIPKAKSVIHAGWEPSSSRPFSRMALLTGKGTWKTPADVQAIRVVLVGGGSGGSSGLKGADGKSMGKHWDHQSAGNVTIKGGSPGHVGSGGKIRTVLIENPASSYSYSCGAGGAGGAVCSSTSTRNPGKAGGDTTFGGYSSSYGTTDPMGVRNLITGDIYGAELGATILTDLSQPIADTTSPGGSTHSFYADHSRYTYYQNGVRKSTIIQPATESGYYYPQQSRYMRMYDGVRLPNWIHAGCPGGTTAKVSGDIGGMHTITDPAIYRPENPNGPIKKIKLGKGGNGATPSVPGLTPLDTGKPLYGWGGGGGWGGGAGGCSGFFDNDTSEYDKYFEAGAAGIGGNGGAGGAGAPGCVIIYY